MQNAHVLEWGCGPGNVSKYLLEQRPDIRLLGFDLAPEMIELARKNCPDGKFEIGNATDFNLEHQSFDGIMAAFLIPFLSWAELQQWICSSCEMLKHSAPLYLSTMLGNYEQSEWIPSSSGIEGEELFIHYYSQNELFSILEENNLKVIWTETLHSPSPTGSATKDILLIAKRNETL